jgi:hypothetical protein
MGWGNRISSTLRVNAQAIDGMVNVLKIIKYDRVLNPLQFPFIRFYEAKGKT